VIYDTSDQLGVVREIMRRVSDTRRYDIKAILARISLAKNAFLDGDDEFPVREGDEYDEITSVVYPKYQRALRGFAALDFDDLIYLPVKLLEDNQEVAARWASKFRYLMVDEYQDTNMAQVRFIRSLIASHGNLCVVGDDDQSIYSWRGADSANILGFSKAFSGATVIKLEQNYRSTSTILNAANAVIENNTDRYGKTLWSDKGDGPGIISATAPDTESEAKFVAQTFNPKSSKKNSDSAISLT
jgi:DNA helicase-2/ATP-dependent DNA helicase PcrA